LDSKAALTRYTFPDVCGRYASIFERKRLRRLRHYLIEPIEVLPDGVAIVRPKWRRHVWHSNVDMSIDGARPASVRA
jgi:hypothetical protein